MENWELAQKHDEDLRKTTQATCNIVNGFITYYNGDAFWQMFRSLGHTSTEARLCTCGADKHFNS